jgi:hypothetical protein
MPEDREDSKEPDEAPLLSIGAPSSSFAPPDSSTRSLATSSLAALLPSSFPTAVDPLREAEKWKTDTPFGIIRHAKWQPRFVNRFAQFRETCCMGANGGATQRFGSRLSCCHFVMKVSWNSSLATARRRRSPRGARRSGGSHPVMRRVFSRVLHQRVFWCSKRLPAAHARRWPTSQTKTRCSFERR